MAQWAALEMMEFVPPVAMCADQPRGGEQVQMLRDRLPGGGQAVFHGESSAQFEQGLTVVIGQFVENCPPGRIGECFEDRSLIGVHTPTIGKYLLAYQVEVVRTRVARVERRLVTRWQKQPQCVLRSRHYPPQAG